MESSGVSSSTVVCVRLLGPLEVTRPTPSGNWQAVKKEAWVLGTPPRSVLKRLLTTPGRHLSRSDIQDDLWPTIGMELATQNLSNGLMVIRRVIGKELVEATNLLCGIVDQSQVWTDLDACSALLREAENRGCTTPEAVVLLEEAFHYFERGRCLEDEIEQWCHAVRADAERTEKQVRLWLAEGYESAGKLWQAEEVYRAMTRMIPPDEEALRKLLQMLTRQGKLPEALRYHQQTRAAWKAQGFAMSPALETFVVQTEQHATPSFSLPPATIPSPFPTHSWDIMESAGNNVKEPGFMDHLRRQISFQGAKMALGLASLPVDLLGRRLLIALTQQPSSDAETTQYLHQRIDHYWQQRQTAKLGPVLVPYVTEDLQRVTALLEGPLLAHARTELTAIAGHLAMLLGELFFEFNLYPEAREYYKTAIIAAHEADNPLLEAVIYGRRCLTWIYQNRLKAALSCVQHGRSLAIDDKHITIWLTAMEAEIQAKMGKQDDCLASLKSAARLRDLPEQKPFYWIHFDVSLLAGYEGACFLRLAKPIEAHRALTQALTMLDATTNRRKPRLLVDLARAYVQQGEIEAACASLLQATDLLHSIKSPLTHKRLLALRQELHPWQETAPVQKLDEALYQFTEMR